MRLRPNTLIAGLLSLAAGAGLMYLLDPESGRRRRALVRDKARRGTNETGRRLRARTTDVGNRARGVVLERVHRFRRERPDDGVLVQRVRSQLGHHTSHAHAIHVEVGDGRAILSGPALAAEVEELVAAVGKVRGIEAVENRLEVHESAENVPALQG
ncbi:MAG: BON domain-containing protein [Thermoanaerobaculia bacterium]